MYHLHYHERYRSLVVELLLLASILNNMVSKRGNQYNKQAKLAMSNAQDLLSILNGGVIPRT